jgi:hypothetical protein
MPGEYCIQAQVSVNVAPAPEGSDPDLNRFAWLTLRTPPVRVKVKSARD